MNILDRFLKNNNCYDDFMINLHWKYHYNTTDELLADVQEDAINCAFGWQSAPKRDEKYWLELSERWRTYLDLYNKNHEETADNLFEI